MVKKNLKKATAKPKDKVGPDIQKINAIKKSENFAWLIKSEGDCYSIDDLKRDKRTPWEGIRNYRARNFMSGGADGTIEPKMRVGDLVLFYHSMGDKGKGEPTGVYGVAKVVSAAHPDMSAQNKKDEHYDPKASADKPIWMCVDMAFAKKFKQPVSLDEIKRNPKLSGMMVAQQGLRLSITPVLMSQFDEVVRLGDL